jgi:hypothetical protein
MLVIAKLAFIKQRRNKMNKIFFTVFMLLFLSACGGGGGGNNNNAGGGGTATVSGTAATGAAFVGVINVYGKNGGEIPDVAIDESGKYSVDVSALTPPFLLCAVPASGSLQPPQSSFASSSGVANITPLTTLVVFNANGGQDPCAQSPKDNWPGQSDSVATAVEAVKEVVNANFAGVFSGTTIDLTNYDFFSTEFDVGDEFDQVLDKLNIDLSGDSPVIDVDGIPDFIFDPEINVPGDGSGGGGDGSGGGGNGSGGSVAGVGPITPLTSSVTLPNGGLGESTTESGFDGDIEFVNEEFQLSNGTTLINVVAVQRVQAADISCADGTDINGTLSSDYSTGVVNLDAVLNSQNVSCTSNFQTILPVSVSDGTSISDLLENWGEDFDPANAAQSGLINTTCPLSVNDDLDINPFTNSCSGSFLSNYTVTDDNGGIHKLSTKITFSAGPLGGGGSGGSGGEGDGSGGGTGGGSGDLGSISIIGNDAEEIGTSYAPTKSFPSLGGDTTFGVSWIDLATGGSFGVGFVNGQVSTVNYSLALSSGGAIGIYSYNLECFSGSNSACGNIALNVSGKKITFTNVTLQAFNSLLATTLATGPITLNGTLFWE